MGKAEMQRYISYLKHEIFNYLKTHKTETAMQLIDYAWDNNPDWIELFTAFPEILYNIRLFIEDVWYEYELMEMCASCKYPSYEIAFANASKQSKKKYKSYQDCLIGDDGNQYTNIFHTVNDVSEEQMRQIFYDAIPQWWKDMNKLFPDKFLLDGYHGYSNTREHEPDTDELIADNEESETA